VTAIWGPSVAIMNLVTSVGAIGTVWMFYGLLRDLSGACTALFLVLALGRSTASGGRLFSE
jgi:hypothetical protein